MRISDWSSDVCSSDLGHPVLAGPGLGDDQLLAHALGEQRLSEHVVDLVGARVVEVLPLAQERAAQLLRAPLRRVQQRRTSGVAPHDVDERGPTTSLAPRLPADIMQDGRAPHTRLTGARKAGDY